MKGELRKGSIGIRESMFQGIAGSAPAGAAVATLTGAAYFSRGSLPLTALIAFLVVMLNAVIISRISKSVAGAGGYYAYVKHGFGARPALFAGFFYIFYQIMALAFIAISVAIFVPAILSGVFGITLPFYSWPLLLVAVLAFGFYISYSGIRESTRYTMYMAIFEIVIISSMGLFMIISRPSINTISVFTPKYALGGFGGVGIGVLLMYTAFAGFGASTPLGEESVSPKKTISMSVIVSVLILGAFFIFSSYFLTVSWGPSLMASYANPQNLAPGVTLIGSYLGPIAAIIVTVLFINSLMTGTVVITNSTSRVMMSMGRDGIIPRSLSNVHAKRKTPYVAAGIITLVAFLISFAGILIMGGFTAFIMAATAATLGVLFVHGMINSSLPSIDLKTHGRFKIENLIMSVSSILILGFIFYSTFLSIDVAVIVGSALFGVWVAFSFVYTLLSGKFGNMQPEAEME
ncbi:MAG: APC family permease [Thermoplasmata archaeon]